MNKFTSKNPCSNSHVLQRGFSLLELMVVIILLGLIIGVVAPQVMGKANQAKWEASKTKIAKLGTAVETYALDMGTPPQSLEDLVSAPGSADNWNGPYAKASDLKDGFNKPLQYRYPGEHSDFDIVSLGQDGQPGGEKWSKDIGSWE